MKLQEIKEKATEELKSSIIDSKKELFELRMGHNKLKQLENTASIRNKKREIARMKTVLRQKELESVKG